MTNGNHFLHLFSSFKRQWVRSILLLIGLMLFSIPSAFAFKGTTPTAGKSYYLYNLYQEKFLNDDGSFSRNATALFQLSAEQTVSLSGNTYKISTATHGYNLLAAADESQALMFGAGTQSAVSTLADGFNKSKAEWLLVSESEYAEYAAKKRFTAASLNVDGMPKSIKIIGIIDVTLNPDAKESEGATAIGKKIGSMGYDFIGLSEDFNFHNDIAANVPESYVFGTHRGKIEATAEAHIRIPFQISPVFEIDGLGFIANSATCSFSNEAWTAWNEHHGYTDSGADGLIDKGYRYYTLTLADGTEIDVYTLHMDAETNTEDNAARESQINQLVAAIKASDNKRPILIMGDTNCRYTRDKLKVLLIDAIDEDPRFTVNDPWIEYGRDNIYPVWNSSSIMANEEGYRSGEVVDKIFYINNTESPITIKAESYLQDMAFINEEGEPLSDHWPCVVEFSYTDNNSGEGGDDGDDEDEDPSEADIDSNTTYYLRNKQTGNFLKAGGWWGTHAVTGDYGSPIIFTKTADGTYKIHTNSGMLCQEDPYMDTASEEEWNIVKDDNLYSITYTKEGTVKALADAGTEITAYGPNRRYVMCNEYSATDNAQKWELLTKDDLLNELRDATDENPINATFLLPGANFDRNDGNGVVQWLGWPTTATRMTSNMSAGKIDYDNGNTVAEVYVDKCPKTHIGSCTHETMWDISQQIELPKGRYLITCQAFQRISNSNTTTAEINLYANESATMVQLMYNTKEITEPGIGSTEDGGFYYPNNMDEASIYFNKGYYQNSVEVEVGDSETLTLGIRKTSDTGKSNKAWTCFDNFNIICLQSGEKPNRITNANATANLLTAIGGERSITVAASSETPVIITSTSGTLMAKFTARQNTPTTIHVAPGIYIVNNKKVLVK